MTISAKLRTLADMCGRPAVMIEAADYIDQLENTSNREWRERAQKAERQIADHLAAESQHPGCSYWAGMYIVADRDREKFRAARDSLQIQTVGDNDLTGWIAIVNEAQRELSGLRKKLSNALGKAES